MVPVRIGRILVVVVLAALGAAACGGGFSGADVPTSAPASNATTAPLLPTNRYALPDFDLAKLQQLLGQLKGTPVVVHIWGSWCGPCRQEGPVLAKAVAAYGDRVQFLGIDIMDSRTSARGFMREFSWTYPSLYDPSALGDIRTQLGFLGQPDTLFYAADGTLAAKWAGPLTDEVLRQDLAKILPAGG